MSKKNFSPCNCRNETPAFEPHGPCGPRCGRCKASWRWNRRTPKGKDVFGYLSEAQQMGLTAVD